MRSQSQSAHDLASPLAFFSPYSLLLGHVDEPDKFTKVKIQLLERLAMWVIQDGLFILKSSVSGVQFA